MKHFKFNFFTLAILFIVHIGLCLFMGSVLGDVLDVDPRFIAGALFVLSHLFRLPTNVLAEVIVNDTTYAGEFYDTFLARLIASADTLTKGLVYVKTGIKKRGTVGTVDVTAFIQSPQDPPRFGGDATVDGRPLIVDPVMGYMEITPGRFEDHWHAVQMNPALLDRALPMTFESAVLDLVTKQNSAWFETIMWRGVKDNAAITAGRSAALTAASNNLIFTDGFIQVCKAALPAANRVLAPTAVAITAANVQSRFQLLKDMILATANGPAIYNHPNFKFVVNYRTGSLYGDAQKAQASKGDDFTSRGVRSFDGRPIVEVFGQHDDTIWAGVASNGLDSELWVGCNEADEETKFQVAKLQANSEKIFIKMLAKFCTQIATPAEAFLYTTK